MGSNKRRKATLGERSNASTSSRVCAHEASAEPGLLDLPSELHVAILVSVERSAREVCTALRDSHDAGTTSLRLSWQAVTSHTATRKALGQVSTLLARLPKLEHLDACGCPKRPVRCLDTVALPQLLSLTLRRSYDIADLSPLASCVLLQRLDLSDCRDVADLSPLASCPSLRTLVLNDCCKATSIASLASCSALQRVGMLKCHRVTNLTPLAASSASLQYLNIHNCSGVTNLSPLVTCTALVFLDLGEGGGRRGLPRTADLSALASLALLRELRLNNWGMADVRPLASCTALQRLNLSSCRDLRDVVPLSACRAIRCLDLHGCLGLRDVSPLASCPVLCSLNLGLCHEALHDLSPLAPCAALQWLGLYNFPGSLDLGALALREGLRITRTFGSLFAMAWSVDTPSLDEDASVTEGA